MGIYDRIFQKSQEKGISIKRLEKEVGLANGVIRRWNNSSPQCNKVMLVANYLQISIEWILTGKECSSITEEDERIIQAYKKADQNIKDIVNTALKPYMQEERSSNSKTG